MKSSDHPPHRHCPNDCEKPQPFVMQDVYGRIKWVCGRCRYEGRGYVEVVLCTPVTCPEDFA